MKLSDKIMTVQPSATLSITSKAKAMRASGEDVVILAAGEPDFDTPDIVKMAAVKAINEGRTKYTPASGTNALKKAICCKISKDNMLEYEPGHIVVSNGAKHSIYNVLQVICNQGDEVIIIPPYWLSYPEMVKLAGGCPVILPMRRENGFKASADDIRAALTKKTRAIIINSPSNPAGVVYGEAELKEIADVCIEKGIIIVSDEIYEKIIFDGKEHFSIAAVSEEAKDLTMVVNGVSKSYSMTGWRIGYIAGNKDIISKISTLQSHSTSNPCSISQEAAKCALTTDLDDFFEKNLEKFQTRRDLLFDLLSGDEKIKPVNPSGAFYMFCNISGTGLDSVTFSEKLLADKKVAVIPGDPFGDDLSIRISFATDQQTLEKGVERIKEWLNKL